MEKPLIIKGILTHCTINEYGVVWNLKTNREQQQVTNNKRNPHKKVKVRIGGGKYLRDYIHRLVAEHFIGPSPKDGMVVNHIDGDHFNDNLDNLIEVTPEEHLWLHQMGHEHLQTFSRDEIREILNKFGGN